MPRGGFVGGMPRGGGHFVTHSGGFHGGFDHFHEGFARSPVHPGFDFRFHQVFPHRSVFFFSFGNPFFFGFGNPFFFSSFGNPFFFSFGNPFFFPSSRTVLVNEPFFFPPFGFSVNSPFQVATGSHVFLGA
jgi:hypothetical protein